MRATLRLRQAYHNYIKLILTRKNTITGVMYSEDPTIMAVELANEPHTKCGRAPSAHARAVVCSSQLCYATRSKACCLEPTQQTCCRLALWTSANIQIECSSVLVWGCSDNVEINAGVKPGTIVKNWVSQTAAFIKTLDTNHMVSPAQKCDNLMVMGKVSSKGRAGCDNRECRTRSWAGPGSQA